MSTFAWLAVALLAGATFAVLLVAGGGRLERERRAAVSPPRVPRFVFGDGPLARVSLRTARPWVKR